MKQIRAIVGDLFAFKMNLIMFLLAGVLCREIIPLTVSEYIQAVLMFLVMFFFMLRLAMLRIECEFANGRNK